MKAYIIIRGGGDYPSDRMSEPERVYLDHAKAVATLAALDGIYKKYRQFITKKYTTSMGTNWAHDREIAERLNPEIKAEYAKIGFDADWSDDWELVEAELDETTK